MVASIVIRATDASTPVQSNLVYIDAAQLTLTAEQRPLLEGNAGVRLWQAANERLRRYAYPSVVVNANLLDVADLDPVAYPFDSFSLGGQVRLIDTEAGLDLTTRIIGWERDWLRRANTRLMISNSPQDISTVMAGRLVQPARGR